MYGTKEFPDKLLMSMILQTVEAESIHSFSTCNQLKVDFAQKRSNG